MTSVYDDVDAENHQHWRAERPPPAPPDYDPNPADFNSLAAAWRMHNNIPEPADPWPDLTETRSA